MKVQTFYPRHPLLKENIEFYYFFSSDRDDYSAAYYVFPHTAKPLNIHRDIEVEIGEQHVFVSGKKTGAYVSILQGAYEQPLLIRLNGRLDKVTIIWKPAALARFIDKDFVDVGSHHSQVFTEWGGPEWEAVMDSFYRTGDLEKRVDLLEDFIVSRYRPRAESELIGKVLGDLEDFDQESNLEEIAARRSMSVRTLHRLVNKYTALSPRAYKKIARFRHSMKHKLFSERFANLTQIGYNSNFYDQSYFNRIYKQMTGANPTAFFRSIERLENELLIFRFINEIKGG